MVVGAPGSGKTMLMKYLALAYGQEKLQLPGRPIPVLLELYRVSNRDLTAGKTLRGPGGLHSSVTAFLMPNASCANP